MYRPENCHDVPWHFEGQLKLYSYRKTITLNSYLIFTYLILHFVRIESFTPVVACDGLTRSYFPWWPYLVIHKNTAQAIPQLAQVLLYDQKTEISSPEVKRFPGSLKKNFSCNKFRLLLSRSACFLIAFKTNEVFVELCPQKELLS